MSPLRFKLYAYRNRLVPMFVLVMVPWIAVALWAPWWMLSISIPLLFVCAWLLFLHVLPTPPARRAVEERRAAEPAAARKGGDPDAQQLLVRMASVTRESKAQLEEVDQQVTEVMTHAESAVVEIGKRFVEVTRKTRKQVELAVALLSNTRAEAEAGEAAESLTDYINKSDVLLKDLGQQLVGLGEELAAVAAKQEAVRQDSKRIDGALDQLAGLASQIRVLALDSSRRGSADNRAFVEMTDRVRDLSMNADESVRAIRRILEDIKGNANTTDNAIRTLAMHARDTGRKSNDQVAELTGATLTKMQEVNQALGEIGGLGEQIQADINKIIIELQFQDITQQKLQRLKQPILSELASSWLTMFEETRAFNSRLVKGEKAELQPTHFRVSRKGGAEPDKPRADPAPGSAPADEQPRRDDGSKVELF